MWCNILTVFQFYGRMNITKHKEAQLEVRYEHFIRTLVIKFSIVVDDGEPLLQIIKYILYWNKNQYVSFIFPGWINVCVRGRQLKRLMNVVVMDFNEQMSFCTYLMQFYWICSWRDYIVQNVELFTLLMVPLRDMQLPVSGIYIPIYMCVHKCMIAFCMVSINWLLLMTGTFYCAALHLIKWMLEANQAGKPEVSHLNI